MTLKDLQFFRYTDKEEKIIFSANFLPTRNIFFPIDLFSRGRRTLNIFLFNILFN